MVPSAAKRQRRSGPGPARDLGPGGAVPFLSGRAAGSSDDPALFLSAPAQNTPDDFDFAFVPSLEAFANWESSREIQTKRAYDDFANQPDLELASWVGDHFEGFLPSIPAFDDLGPIDLATPNPLLDPDEIIIIHPMLRHPPSYPASRTDRVINALIKFRFAMPEALQPTRPIRVLEKPLEPQASSATGVDLLGTPNKPSLRGSISVSRLPPSFGQVALNNQVDKFLHEFYLGAVCPGRTVVKTDNAYETQITPMAERSPLVKHAILSLSATYILDFKQHRRLTDRANFHHAEAIRLLTEELSTPGVYQPGKEEAVVAALYLLAHNENINWEARRREANPKWHRCGLQAKAILERSDPGQQFAKPKNVQCTEARTQLAALWAQAVVFSDCFYPLDLTATAKKCSWSWLMQGDERTQRKVTGMNGLSPKLIHLMARTTYLASQLYKDPGKQVTLGVAKEIERLYRDFGQWSDLSPGFYDNSDEAIAALPLDDKGKCATAVAVNQIHAHQYALAAHIYLQCRVFRHTRKHPKVQALLKKLLKCIEMTPTSGDLYAADSPLFTVFLAGVVSYTPEQRQVISTYFGPTSSESRGNVTPAWQSLNFVWSWLDANDLDFGPLAELDTPVDGLRLSALPPWWEHFAQAVADREGRLNMQ